MRKKEVISEEKVDRFECAVRYFPDSKYGLTSEQVKERIDNKLTNEKRKNYSKTLSSIIFHNVFTFFNMLLLTIAVALIAVGAFTDLFFLFILVLNTIIGIYQEYKAKKTVDKLKLLTEPMTSVIRNGIETIIECDKIVLDDVVVLCAGKEIPIDGEIIDGVGEVNESLLTGESIPLKKNVGDHVFAGSFVVSGTLYIKTEKLGDFTYISKLQETAKKTKKVSSSLIRSLNAFIKIISTIIIPLGIISFIVNFMADSDLYHVIGKTAGSLVSMIPSGLFLLVSTTLYISVTALGRKKAMVQEMYSIESLARSNVLCLDKTGTITDGTMHLTNTMILNQKEEDLENIISSFLNAFKESNLTSDALKRKYYLKTKYESSIIIPFSSERKYSAVTFKNGCTYFLGAPEYLTNDQKVFELVQKQLELGNRVLIFTKVNNVFDESISKTGIPICLFVIEDHIREDAFDTVKWFQDNSVELKVISGDNPYTVKRIAEIVGINNSDKYISLENMSLEEVKNVACEYTIFGRVSPEQKEVIVKTLKKNGKTVAMTGDGVNDILALKQANCAIAMASGSEAARNCSHIVLMNSSFSSMPRIVEEGRKVINNIQSTASLYIMKTIYSILLTLIVVSTGLLMNIPIFNLPTISYPFTPKHLYILEMAVIGIPSLFLALQPNKNIIEGNFFKTVLSKAAPGGIALLISVLLSMFVVSNIPFFNLSSIANMADGTVNLSLSIAVISFSVVGLLILLTICLPLNKYRTIVYVGMIFLAFAIGLLSYVMKIFDFNGFGIEHILAILFNAGISFVVYLICYFIVGKQTISEKFINNLANKVEERQEVESDEE